MCIFRMVKLKAFFKNDKRKSGDLNGHVGESRIGFERWHGGFSVGERNKGGDNNLHLAQALTLQW